MIPKKIHYCWFGGKELPLSAKKCINSWKKYFPDYEIIEWNENNFDVSFNKYAKEAYDNKKYAFFTDVARLYIIYKYGGIYFDVDVEVINSYDEILSSKVFFGLEKIDNVNTGLGFGAEKENAFIKELLSDYDNRNFIKEDGSFDMTSCPIINSKKFKEKGFLLNNTKEEIEGIVVYPREYFNPLDSGTNKLIYKTINTKSIHWYLKSWVSKKIILRSKITRPFHRLFGNDCFKWLKK